MTARPKNGKKKPHKKAGRNASHANWTWRCKNCRVVCDNRRACWSCGAPREAYAANP